MCDKYPRPTSWHPSHIRNSAAHFDKSGKGFEVLFDSDQTIDQVANLANAMNLKLESRKPEYIKQIFITTARLAATKLLFRCTLSENAKQPSSFKEIANKFRSDAKGTYKEAEIAELDRILINSPEKLPEYIKDIALNLKNTFEKPAKKKD